MYCIPFQSFFRKMILPALGFLVLLVTVRPNAVHAQRPIPAVAQVGPGSPLPVYVVNDDVPRLPPGFIPGSTWKFTTWTTPSTLAFTATVQRAEGGWAQLTVNGGGPGNTRWYYVPQMPGAWEPQ